MARRIAGFVPRRVFRPSTRRRAMASMRSIVDALTASTFSRTPASSFRWPCRSSAGRSTGTSALSPLPQMRSAASHRNDENLAHRLIVEPQARHSHRRDRSRVVVQLPDRVFAVVSGDRHEFVQDPQLVFSRCLPIPFADRLHQLSTSIHANFIDDRCILSPATAGSRFGEATTHAR